ncbi:MAG: hypothetical protein FLDDKLPJ_00570 [Phycisphaerae bacterium]|nr:hypothetical protein [Phycisphaerae bacterium]
MIALAVIALGTAVFAVAAFVQPNPQRIGTHTQLGFPPCTAMLLTGYPCPSCGMTTAFAWTVRGRIDRAFAAQPAGALLALGAFAATLAAFSTLVTGKSWRVNWILLPPHRLAAAVVMILLASWIYKLIRT